MFVAFVVALLAGSCSRGGSDGGKNAAQCTGGSVCLDALASGAAQADLLDSQTTLPTEGALFTFAMVTKQGGLITGGSPEVWIARDRTSRPLGPFRSAFYQFTPNPEDKSPRSPLTGFYAATVKVPAAGSWLFSTVAKTSQGRLVGTGSIDVTSDGGPAAIGSKAVSVRTPVATTEAAAKRICTRDPPDDMHYISLDRALKNGKPTVVTFATPLLCESQLCGPVVDEQLLAFEKIGAKQANFVHVEEFPPGPDLRPDTSKLPTYWQKWGFTTEPWTIVIDRKGIIRARFEGPVVADLIEDALKPLL
jgi:hypothetical protein